MSSIDLTVKPVNIKLSAGAHARAKDIAQRNDLKLQDVFSACLQHMPEAEIVRICAEQAAAIGALPKAIRSVMANVHKMSPDEKKAIIDALS